MNFRKSLRSLHQSGSQSVKKIQLNALDLQDCNSYAQAAQSTKQSENSILNKLLLQPPSLKAQQSNKLTLQAGKKYQPKFQKPDVQNLIQQNINLKNVIQCHLQSINQLKVKIIELEKKIKLLQKGLEKVERQEQDMMKENTTLANSKHERKQAIVDTKAHLQTSTQGQQAAKPSTIHTEILKKKITDLTEQNISAEKELKFLKKLPNITVYEQNDTEKEHLMAETIRLKSIISSLSEQPDTEQTEKFQNQFMRLMKEQNEKLKATIRLLQNDKILLKSRQTIQNKLNSDLKKEIEHFKNKLLYKESQLEKINNENKNLLFKKTTQFRQQQQKKENELVTELRAKLVSSENERIKHEQNIELYSQQNEALKQKEKNLTQQITEIETKYDKVVKKLNEEIQQLQEELSNVKTDYLSLLNSRSHNKKRTFAVSKQSSTSSNNLRDSIKQIPSTINTTEKLYVPNGQQTYARPVKWEDISLAMAHLYIVVKDNAFLSLNDMLHNIEEEGYVSCGQLASMFMEEPFQMNRKEAMKLARYICEDPALSSNTKVLENENLVIETSLAKTIINSSIQKMTQKLSPLYVTSWSRILKKTLKLPQLIRQLLKEKTHIHREDLCSMINRSSREKVQFEEYEYLMLKCMDLNLSTEDFVLSVDKVKEFIENILNHQMEEDV